MLAQDYENFELIISDNSSTDKTVQICEEYALNDSRIRLQIQTCNVGIRANFEKVLEIANVEYFMWAAVDDYWCPGFISTLVPELNSYPLAGVVMCAVDCVSEDGHSTKTIKFHGAVDPNRMNFFQMANKITTPIKYNFFI